MLDYTTVYTGNVATKSAFRLGEPSARRAGEISPIQRIGGQSHVKECAFTIYFDGHHLSSFSAVVLDDAGSKEEEF